MTEQSVNVPQVLVFLVVTFLAVRWYFSKPSGSATRPIANQPRLNYAQVDQLAQMFPQLSRRDIGWDMQRNGGNVGATTERILSGRGLDTAPAQFQLPAPRRSNATQAPSASPARKPAHPDLITRYNLSSKLGQSAEPPVEESPKPKAWSQDRNERQANLQKRREEMILAARRKLEEKEREKAKSSATAP